ncbi:MAG: ABC transporter permease [Candidatus Omnitrophota bacterium]
MNRFRLVVNSLLYYWKTNISVALGTMFAAMALTGALIVGDSVDHTLRSTALKRLGNVRFAMSHPSRQFRDALADEFNDSPSIQAAPVFQLKAIARKGDGSLSANNVNVYGVDRRFWNFGRNGVSAFDEKQESVWINRTLAQRLGVRENDEIILRIENPSSISREIPLTTVDDSSLACRLPIAEILGDEQMGRFDLNANQTPPSNAFVPLKFLQDKTGKHSQINMLLAGGKNENTEITANSLNAALQSQWSLEDVQLECQPLSRKGTYEIHTDRIFLEPNVLRGVSEGIEQNTKMRPWARVLTYFVNEFRVGERSAPYSMVAAIEESNGKEAAYPELQNLPGDKIVINEWLANDINARIGDELTLTYNVLGPMRQLIERKRAFIVHAIVPMSHPLCDPSLMPDFPGISTSEHCREWDPGFLIDLKKIRDKDEEYWNAYRGTPKAFISLKTGQEIWGNRFGELTAIRFQDESSSLSQIEANLSRYLSPDAIGLQFQPVREIALRAVDQAMNFAPLFVSLSFFLIAAAVTLAALLFFLSTERRARQMGILFAIGFNRKRIRRLLLGEGIILSAVGCALGIIAALLYSRCAVWALSTVWSGAVAGIQFVMTYSPITILKGFIIGMVVSSAAIGFAVRRQSQAPVRALLSVRGEESALAVKKSRWGVWLAAASFAVALALLFFVSPNDAAASAGQFFGIGALLLIGGLGACHAYLARTPQAANQRYFSLASLRKKNIGRRRGRSLAVIGVLASGCFIIIAVGANRRDASTDADSRSSGTGGFAYYCETTIPILYDLNTEKGCNEFGLSRSDAPDLAVYPLRLREGDDASCLNLNRAQNPKLIGVNAESFASLGAFRFVKIINGETAPEKAWRLLDESEEDGSIPAVIDQSTAMWALGKSIGDKLTYTDERGEAFDIRVVGFLSDSIFQGSVLISEKHFLQRYPSSGGYRLALMDIPAGERSKVRGELMNALQNIGLEMTPASERLAAFLEVENTYLAIFQFLGGLGLVLGCAGIGVVVSRNILERQYEFALMRAVGFTPASIRRAIVSEHAVLVALGLGCGLLAGLIAALPSLRLQSSSFPFASLLLTLIFIAASGFASVYFSTVLALSENLLKALRSE